MNLLGSILQQLFPQAFTSVTYYVSQLHSLIENHEPDEFTTACRNALLQIICEMPADQARIIYDHVTIPCPWTTQAEHESWLNSYQCKAMRLELTLKEQAESQKKKNET